MNDKWIGRDGSGHESYSKTLSLTQLDFHNFQNVETDQCTVALFAFTNSYKKNVKNANNEKR